MNHKGTNTRREPIPDEVENVAREIQGLVHDFLNSVADCSLPWSSQSTITSHRGGLVGPASVPVILAVASSQGVTGRDAGPTGSRLGMVGQWIPRVMKVATENVSPYLGNPALGHGPVTVAMGRPPKRYYKKLR